MKMRAIASTSAVLIVCAALTGCATSRSEVKLSMPAAPAQTAAVPANGKTVYIRSVTDERVFEENPSNPSVPSLGFGGAQKASADVKARAIGRKRSGFGHAEGDVLLQHGQTVTGVVEENLAAALRRAGYSVVTAPPAAGASPIVMDVAIKQFWAWFRPGFWETTLTCNIWTDLTVAERAKPVAIMIKSQQGHFAATDSAWIEVVKAALAKYQEQVLKQAGDLQ